jgi:hypothetical protein
MVRATKAVQIDNWLASHRSEQAAQSGELSHPLDDRTGELDREAAVDSNEREGDWPQAGGDAE